MNPALSVILFTTLSGAGYGLLAFTGLFGALGLWPAERWLGFWSLGLGLILVTAGLLSSTLHLGHPERSWRALSQWRSSWLSREGVMALATFVPVGLLGFGWVILQDASGFFAMMGLLTTALALGTVYCTAMIYASLATVPQWNVPHVVPQFLLFALSTGSLWALAFSHAFAVQSDWLDTLAPLLLIVTWLLKASYWLAIGRLAGESTIESATGLGHLGRVRMWDPPHTEENYLLKEMGHRVARKHASKLRVWSVGLGLVLPLLLLGAIWLGDLTRPGGAILALLAALSATLGALIERWLFFAEATHKVTLYYGAKAV